MTKGFRCRKYLDASLFVMNQLVACNVYSKYLSGIVACWQDYAFSGLDPWQHIKFILYCTVGQCLCRCRASNNCNVKVKLGARGNMLTMYNETVGNSAVRTRRSGCEQSITFVAHVAAWCVMSLSKSITCSRYMKTLVNVERAASCLQLFKKLSRGVSCLKTC